MEPKNNANNTSIWETIFLFVTNQLSAEEYKAFEERIKNDPDLQEKVRFVQATELQEKSTLQGQLETGTESSVPPDLKEELDFWNDIEFVVQNKQLIDDIERIEQLPSPPSGPVFVGSLPAKKILAIAAAIFVALAFCGVIIFSQNNTSKVNWDKIPIYPDPYVSGISAIDKLQEGEVREAIQELKIKLLDSPDGGGSQEGEALGPKYIKFYLAQAYIKNKDYKKAEELLENLEPLDDKPEKLFLGLLHFQSGDYEKARPLLEDASTSSGIMGPDPDGEGNLLISEIAKEYLVKIKESESE